MAETGPSELYVEIIEWMGRLGLENAKELPQPVRYELKTPDDILKVRLNGSPETITDGGTELPPYSIIIEAEKYIQVAILDPYDGALGGFNEDDLIETFKAATP